MTSLASRRRRAVRAMVDEGVARRATGETTTDPVTGSDTAVLADVFFSPCSVQDQGLTAQRPEVGGRTATEVSSVLKLPASVPEAVLPGDLWVITSAAQASACRAGQEFTIIREIQRSHAKDRAFVVEEIVA